ncbi:hypothetical protein [Streptomyces dysideae]|uniref:Uncharacterized protein n=1 Tax=Streptomyces dysideae TaxID=909626 RepID=A0A117S1T8_9ACTN|nr:hypothetical protein [Streptomyces dysideae]KUO21575.1 hypothetical protein AQJ91_08250 [Streptomyces dysideae]
MTIDRRTLLLGAGATAALVALPRPAQAAADATAAAANTKTWSADHSDNGWSIEADTIEPFRIEGSPATVRLHPGAAALLLHVARRWHYEVSPLRGAKDVLGHRTDRAVAAAFESNYLSGTAIALPGAGDGLWPHQKAIVRDILADCDGVVRWGADLSPAAEGHFQIDVRPDSKTLTRLTATFDNRSVKRNGPRPGAVDDPTARERRAKARRLEQVQADN